MIDTRTFVPHLGSPKTLTKSQIQEFNINGFVIIKSFIPTKYFNHAREVVINEMIPKNNRSIKFIEKEHDAFQELGSRPQILQAIEDINGPSWCHESFTFTKLPGDTRIKNWHQDAIYWNPSDAKLVTVFIPLSEISKKHGCVYFFPRSHRIGRLYHYVEKDTHEFPNLVCDVSSFRKPVAGDVKPGDIILSHDHIIHASFRNYTNEPRLMVGYHFANNDTQVIVGRTQRQKESATIHTTNGTLHNETCQQRA